MNLQTKIVLILFLYINNIGIVKAKNDSLTLHINAKALHNDFIRVFYSNTPSKYNSKNQIKKIIKKGELQEIEFRIPYTGTIPYLRIDWGEKPSNFFEIQSINFQLGTSDFKLEAESINAYFSFNNYIEIIDYPDSSFNIKTTKLKGKFTSWGLRFEKITNILYQLEKIDTVFESQIELETNIEDDSFVLVYYSDNELDVPVFSYGSSVRIKGGTNTIYTENHIRHLRIMFYGKELNKVILKKIAFSSDFVNFELKGSKILSKFNVVGSKEIPIISAEEIKFIMNTQPAFFIINRKIESRNEILFSSLKNLFLLCSSVFLLFIFNIYLTKNEIFATKVF